MTEGVTAPLNSPAQEAGEAPLCLPTLQRPIGWRELDDATLLARVRSLLASEVLQPVVVVQKLNDSEERGQESSSGTSASSEKNSRPSPLVLGIRFPGWLLVASLVLASLQLFMLLVAVDPLEVIAVFRRSANEWQSTHPRLQESANSKEEEPTSPKTPLDPANWWQSKQKISKPEPVPLNSETGSP